MRSRKDAETLITRNQTRAKLKTHMLEENNTGQTDVEMRIREGRTKGNKEEEEFNEKVKVEVQGIGGSTRLQPVNFGQ